MKIVICGVTGVIGQQVLDVAKRFKHEIVGISFNNQVEKANQIIKQLNIPYYFCHSNPNLGNVKFLDELFLLAKPHMVINAVTGYSGLNVSSMALNHKIDLGLANKESMVIAGYWLKQIAIKNKVQIYPIDSEHSALYTMLKNIKKNAIDNLYITASGGPFWDVNKKDLKNVTYKQAINHPKWKMGPKISIDCATLSNKAFELIEAFHFFNTKNIIPIRHKESIIHAGVKFKDNSYIFLASVPDMRLSIASCLNRYSYNIQPIIKPINFSNLLLNFENIKEEEYPIFKISKDIINKPKTTRGVVFNVVNDYAVKLFIDKKITFDQITHLIINFYKKYSHRQLNGMIAIYSLIDELNKILSNTWKEYL